MNSPLDSVLNLLMQQAHLLARNDDCTDHASDLYTPPCGTPISTSKIPRRRKLLPILGDVPSIMQRSACLRLRISPRQPRLQALPSRLRA